MFSKRLGNTPVRPVLVFPSTRGSDGRCVVCAQAMQRQQNEDDEAMASSERDRGYNSLRTGQAHGAPSDAEMEAYHLRRQLADDPMSGFT